MRFNADKMKRFLNEDLLLKRMVKDLVSRNIPEEEALEIVFNSEVLNDYTMEDIYMNI